MNIVWFSWKDRTNPLAGGAETISGEIMDRLTRDGHNVTLITSKYAGAKSDEMINGVRTLRSGGRYSVYIQAYRSYKKNIKLKPDLIIDEMNTIPFAAGLYAKANKKYLLAYQLAREVWFYQMIFPLSLIGYLCEPIMLRLISVIYDKALTESNSSKEDLKRNGIKDVRVFRIGIGLQTIGKVKRMVPNGTILSLGSVRPMKRTLLAVKAFEHARDKNNSLKMIIAGDIGSKYAQKVIRYVNKSRHSQAINIKGRISDREKLLLMRGADLILVTSIKEGWGLIVTEANSQGTPAIAFDVDGLRDSVQDNVTGLLVPDKNYKAMGDKIVSLTSDSEGFNDLRKKAWSWSKSFTFENSYKDFINKISS